MRKRWASTTIGSTFGPVLQVTDGNTFTVSLITLNNSTGAPVTVRVCYVPIGSNPVQGNSVVWDAQIQPNSWVEFGKGQILPGSSSIMAMAGGAASINIFVSGVEE